MSGLQACAESVQRLTWYPVFYLFQSLDHHAARPLRVQITNTSDLPAAAMMWGERPFRTAPSHPTICSCGHPLKNRESRARARVCTYYPPNPLRMYCFSVCLLAECPVKLFAVIFQVQSSNIAQHVSQTWGDTDWASRPARAQYKISPTCARARPSWPLGACRGPGSSPPQTQLLKGAPLHVVLSVTSSSVAPPKRVNVRLNCSTVCLMFVFTAGTCG